MPDPEPAGSLDRERRAHTRANESIQGSGSPKGPSWIICVHTRSSLWGEGGTTGRGADAVHTRRLIAGISRARGELCDAESRLSDLCYKLALLSLFRASPESSGQLASVYRTLDGFLVGSISGSLSLFFPGGAPHTLSSRRERRRRAGADKSNTTVRSSPPAAVS